ncbi:MAG: glycosyltransferase family 2 protein [Lachnospiraceae bacterium]|nr:glycosyltransferase family 2 protein [Lachnospiraceae bacterium]
MVQKKVSMIMPVFNSAPYLDHMLESVYSQTYDNVELIIAYDDSTDGTLNILMNWKKKFDKRGYGYMIVKNSSRAGIVNGINAAMPYYTGEYITFPDSDDYMLPEFVEEMVRALEEHPEYNWARCDNYKVIGRDLSFDVDNIGDFDSEIEYGREYDRGFDERYEDLGSVLNLLLYTIPRAPWRMMCKTKFLEKALHGKRFYPHPSSHELPIALPLAAAEEFLYVPKPLYKYTIHKDGYYNSRTKNLHQMIPYLDSMEQLARDCINLLEIDDRTREKYQLASRLYYCGTKAYYAKIHGANELSEIYARWLDDCMLAFTQNDEITNAFPYMLYWKYYFRLSPKIAAGAKLVESREQFSEKLWNAVEKAANVVLYGAGNNCRDVMDLLIDQGITVSEIWDAKAEKIVEKYGYKIRKAQSGKNDTVVIVTILNGNIADQVKEMLLEMGYHSSFVLTKDDMDMAFRYAMLKKYFPELI